jgi:hypothetical protein
LILQTAVFLLFLLIFSGLASAHCPLCTAGAGAAAAGAAYLGVAKPVLGLFIGALGVSMGWWFAKKIPKEYIPYQKEAIIIVSFLLTVVPILPIIGQQQAFFIGLYGSYGSLLHNTYMYDMSLLTSIIGGIVVTLSPRISGKITEIRGKHIDYQGILVTFAALTVLGLVIQFI